MALDKKDVLNIAHLARLAVNAQDVPEYARNLSGILQFVEKMNEIDTTDIRPMAHPLDTEQRLREDVVTEHDQREHFQAIAPAIENGLYLVPKVIE